MNGSTTPVEDNAQDLDLALRAPQQACVSNRIQMARDGAKASDFIFGERPRAGPKRSDSPRVAARLKLKLPKVDGREVVKRLEGDPRTKITALVIFTSFKKHQDLVESYQLGERSYIVKPVSLERFAEVVRDLGFHCLPLNPPPKVVD